MVLPRAFLFRTLHLVQSSTSAEQYNARSDGVVYLPERAHIIYSVLTARLFSSPIYGSATHTYTVHVDVGGLIRARDVPAAVVDKSTPTRSAFAFWNTRTSVEGGTPRNVWSERTKNRSYSSIAVEGARKAPSTEVKATRYAAL